MIRGQETTAKPALTEAAAPSVDVRGLRLAASRGSVEAFSALCELSIDLGNEGRLPADEALSAAEVFAFLAAARGGRTEKRTLVSLLDAKERNFIAAGDRAAADWYRNAAIEQLRLLDADGDPAAAEALAERGCAVREDGPRREALASSGRALIADAAGGDLSALAAMIDGNLLNFNRGATHPLHALIHAEELAWIGGVTGDRAMLGKLAGILALRCFFEWDQGRRDCASFYATETVAVALVGLNEDPSFAQPLSDVINQLPEPLLVAAAQAHPAALNFRAPIGTA